MKIKSAKSLQKVCSHSYLTRGIYSDINIQVRPQIERYVNQGLFVDHYWLYVSKAKYIK